LSVHSYEAVGEVLGYLVINPITASTFLIPIIGFLYLKTVITHSRGYQ